MKSMLKLFNLLTNVILLYSDFRERDHLWLRTRFIPSIYPIIRFHYIFIYVCRCVYTCIYMCVCLCVHDRWSLNRGGLLQTDQRLKASELVNSILMVFYGRCTPKPGDCNYRFQSVCKLWDCMWSKHNFLVV